MILRADAQRGGAVGGDREGAGWQRRAEEDVVVGQLDLDRGAGEGRRVGRTGDADGQIERVATGAGAEADLAGERGDRLRAVPDRRGPGALLVTGG